MADQERLEGAPETRRDWIWAWLKRKKVQLTRFNWNAVRDQMADELPSAHWPSDPTTAWVKDKRRAVHEDMKALKLIRNEEPGLVDEGEPHGPLVFGMDLRSMTKGDVRRKAVDLVRRIKVDWAAVRQLMMDWNEDHLSNEAPFDVDAEMEELRRASGL